MATAFKVGDILIQPTTGIKILITGTTVIRDSIGNINRTYKYRIAHGLFWQSDETEESAQFIEFNFVLFNKKVGDSLHVRLNKPIDFIPIDINLNDIKTSGCNHKWKTYQGLFENYEYCEICDEKK